MTTTTVTVDLATDGRHEIRKALGSSAQDAAKAEDLANHYVSHFLPNGGKVAGMLTLSIQQNKNSDFTHSITFTGKGQEATSPVEQEIVDLDALCFDNPRFTNVDGGGGKKEKIGRRKSARARQPSVTDSVLPLESSDQHDDAEVSDLPCLRCAKRIIYDSKSQSATIAERKRPDLDGTVRLEAYSCRHKKDEKCSYISCAKQLGKRCDEVCLISRFESFAALIRAQIPKAIRATTFGLLKRAAAVLAGAEPLAETKANALEAQANMVSMAHGARTATKPATSNKRKRKSGKLNPAPDSDVEMSPRRSSSLRGYGRSIMMDDDDEDDEDDADWKGDGELFGKK